jgi:hypothetical protein
MNRIFAIPAAAPAIPAKPNKAAINAIIRKVIVQPNIFTASFTNRTWKFILPRKIRFEEELIKTRTTFRSWNLTTIKSADSLICMKLGRSRGSANEMTPISDHIIGYAIFFAIRDVPTINCGISLFHWGTSLTSARSGSKM